MLILLNVTITSEEIAKKNLEGHGRFLNENFDKGFFKWFGPYLPMGTGGFAIIEAESIEAALKVLENDPLTRNGGCVNELHEVKSTRFSSDLTALAK